MKSRTRTKYRRSHPALYAQAQPRPRNLRPFAWLLIAAFGLLMLTHLLSGCTPQPAHAAQAPYPTPYPTPQSFQAQTASPQNTPSPARVARISTGNSEGKVNVRACPSTACAVLFVLSENATFIPGQTPGLAWTQALTLHGQGWIYSRYVVVGP